VSKNQSFTDVADAAVVGVASAIGGLVIAAIVLVVLIRAGWFDGPGGFMAIFPLGLLGAITGGCLGYFRRLAKLEKANLAQQSSDPIAPNQRGRLE
jgi:uncharacterized membrane protein